MEEEPGGAGGGDGGGAVTDVFGSCVCLFSVFLCVLDGLH